MNPQENKIRKLVILAAKDISQNRRVPLLASFFANQGYEVTVYAFTKPHSIFDDVRVDFKAVASHSIWAQILDWIEKTEGETKDIWRPRFNGSYILGWLIGSIELIKFKFRGPLGRLVCFLWGNNTQKKNRKKTESDETYAHILRDVFGSKIADKGRSIFHSRVMQALDKNIKLGSTILCHDRFSAETTLKLACPEVSLLFDVVELFRHRSRKSLETKTSLQIREIEAAETLLTNSTLITVGEGIPQELGFPNNMQVIYNGRPFSDWCGKDTDSRDPNLIVFSGSFFQDCGLKNLLNVLVYLPLEINLRLVGSFSSITYRKEIIYKISQNQLENRVDIITDCEVNNIPEVLADGALYILPFSAESPNLRVSMPNRLFDALAAGLPIFSNRDLYLTNWLSSREIGKSIDITNTEEAAQMIVSFLGEPLSACLYKRIKIVFQNTSYESQMSALQEHLGFPDAP